MLSRIKNIKFFIRDSNKKPTLRIVKELFIYGWIKKEFPLDYIRKCLYRKDVENFKNYLSFKEYKRIVNSPKMHIKEIAELMDNKISFALRCKKYNIPVPNLASYNLKNRFFLNNTYKIIKNEDDLISFFLESFEKNNKNTLFLKPVHGIGGKGCILLKKAELESQLKLHFKDLVKTSYIHQEVIIQHPTINLMNDKSVNSLRIDTFIDKNSEVHILASIMRFGMGKSITDNITGGGFFVLANEKTKSLKGNGMQYITNGNKLYDKHPDTNTKIDGFEIPYYDEAMSLIKKATGYFPNRLIGWDLAISENGPIIIEANPYPTLHMTGNAYGGYLKNPIIKDILKEVKN